MSGQKIEQVRQFPVVVCQTCNGPFFPPAMATNHIVSLAQTRTALEAILNDLHKEDHFALIVFDSSILTWKETLVKATAGNVSKAISYVRRIKDRGGKKNALFFFSYPPLTPPPPSPFLRGNERGKSFDNTLFC